jgi:hypothetical protein
LLYQRAKSGEGGSGPFQYDFKTPAISSGCVACAGPRLQFVVYGKRIREHGTDSRSPFFGSQPLKGRRVFAPRERCVAGKEPTE